MEPSLEHSKTFDRTCEEALGRAFDGGAFDRTIDGTFDQVFDGTFRGGMRHTVYLVQYFLDSFVALPTFFGAYVCSQTPGHNYLLTACRSELRKRPDYLAAITT